MFGAAYFEHLVKTVAKLSTKKSVFKRDIIMAEFSYDDGKGILPKQWKIGNQHVSVTTIEFIEPGLKYFFDLWKCKTSILLEYLVHEVRSVMRSYHGLSCLRWRNYNQEKIFLLSTVE